MACAVNHNRQPQLMTAAHWQQATAKLAAPELAAGIEPKQVSARPGLVADAARHETTGGLLPFVYGRSY
jgi:hypothetical protein